MFHEAQGQEMSGVPSVMGRQVRAGTGAAAPGEMVLECLIRVSSDAGGLVWGQRVSSGKAGAATVASLDFMLGEMMI